MKSIKTNNWLLIVVGTLSATLLIVTDYIEKGMSIGLFALPLFILVSIIYPSLREIINSKKQNK